MLNIFVVFFIAFYGIVKWRYILPSLLQHKHVQFNIWPFSLAAVGFAVAHLAFGVIHIEGLPYTQLFCALISLLFPQTQTYKSCTISVFFSVLHILKKGTLPQAIVSVISLVLLARYYYMFSTQKVKI